MLRLGILLSRIVSSSSSSHSVKLLRVMLLWLLRMLLRVMLLYLLRKLLWMLLRTMLLRMLVMLMLVEIV